MVKVKHELTEYSDDEYIIENYDESSSQDEEDFANEDEFMNIFEDYSHPTIDQTDTPNPPRKDQSTWILIWIMKFRSRYRLPDTATESLIKFVKLLLKECKEGGNYDFPKTLGKAKKYLGMSDQFISFAACQKCNKLYKKDDVKNAEMIMKCSHIEFPNSAKKRFKKCQSPLAKVTDENKFRPELIYPVATIWQQVHSMFKRPGFEELLRHWINRSPNNNVLSDIYDGQVWKTFEDSSEQGNKFFRPDKADTHLGLMINLDWFQPYKRTMHSTGVLYATICNLPRDVRFLPENMLILGILPGPNEVSLHKINHHLSPIISELESFWGGITLNNTHECPNGKNIRAALILVSCDIPAARKLCGHISALVACHRCEKKANYADKQHNFGRISDMDEWFAMKDSTKHRQDASNW